MKNIWTNHINIQHSIIIIIVILCQTVWSIAPSTHNTYCTHTHVTYHTQTHATYNTHTPTTHPQAHPPAPETPESSWTSSKLQSSPVPPHTLLSSQAVQGWSVFIELMQILVDDFNFLWMHYYTYFETK